MTTNRPQTTNNSATSGDSNATSDTFSIVPIPEHSEFELLDGDARIGYAKYERADTTIVFTHTVVESAYEGMGLGSRLARHVLDDAVANGLRIVPECSFIFAYLRRHHEYDAHVDWPDANPAATGGLEAV